MATPKLEIGIFRRSVILVCDHDAEGAIGLILNRPSGQAVADHLPSWTGMVAVPPEIFVGGPVQPEVAVGLAVGEASFTIEVPGFDRKVGLVDVSSAHADEASVRIFSGYAGWSPGQLNAELEEGSWWDVAALELDLLTSRPADLWRTVVSRQKNEVAMFATFPERPGLN